MGKEREDRKREEEWMEEIVVLEWTNSEEQPIQKPMRTMQEAAKTGLELDAGLAKDERRKEEESDRKREILNTMNFKEDHWQEVQNHVKTQLKEMKNQTTTQIAIQEQKNRMYYK